jgi:hypothetical protein
MDYGEILIHDIEQMLDDIVSDRIQVRDLALEQLEAVMDYIRDVFTDMLGGEHEELAEGMLELVDVIHTAIENRSVAEAESESWDQDILASVERGNTYFEMENYVVQ